MSDLDDLANGAGMGQATPEQLAAIERARPHDRVHRERGETVSDPIQALAEASAWNLKHQERIATLERERAEAQAQVGAMREALKELPLFVADCIDNGVTVLSAGEVAGAVQARCLAALAPEAGRELLAWRESAMRVLAEWHEAREIIGGAQLGDGPIEWARRVLARLRVAEAPRVTIESAFAQTEQALKVADMFQKTSDGRVARARAAAIEEAAKVAEREHKRLGDRQIEGRVSRQIASAIRALAASTSPDGEK